MVVFSLCFSWPVALRPTRLTALAAGLFVMFLAWSWSPPAVAQTLSAEQLLSLQGLSSAEQQALIEQADGKQDAPLEQPGIARPKGGVAGTAPDSGRLRGGDSVLLDLGPASAALADGAAEELRRRALAANPYKLDKAGRLHVPGLTEPIPLAGLTAGQATERLTREPAFGGLSVRLTLLDLSPIGVEALRPFGYDLFANVPTTFAPATDIPVPAEYAVGPGDTVKIQFIGNVKGRYSLVVGRDGEIRLPEIGPVAVAGLGFDEMREMLERTVSEQMIGTRVAVSLGELRSLRVLVTGEAERPGSYTVSSLSTLTNALLISGGVKPIGSLRTIQLKRAGKLVATLDLYDLLLRGDSRDDARIMSGDVIFIPPVGTTAGVAGEIRRPAIYEYKGAATAWDLVSLGGGLTVEAAPALATLERIDPAEGRILMDVDLTTAPGRATKLRTGDVLRIQAIRETLSNPVTVSGHVFRPAASEFRAGLRLTDLLPGVDELKPNADLNYVLIRRELPPDRRVTVLSADLARAWQNPQSAANVALAPRDRVIVFDMEGSRGNQLNPILAELHRQSTREQPTATVSVGGNVRMPGEYPLESGMTVADLVRAGGSLSEAAFGGEAELARYEVVNGQSRQTALISIDLGRALAGEATADLVLQPFDLLTIRRLPQWSAQESVVLEGEVRFPGTYPILRGETLAQVLERAGGLTDLAFVDGVVFTRQSLREREAQQIAALTDRLERDLAAMAVQTSQTPQSAAQGAQSLSAGQSLLAELRQAQPVGRLAIDMRAVMKAEPGSAADILLKNEDRLVVPRRSQEVTVLGEVQTVTSHLHQARLSRDDYVNLSGGLTQKADSGRIYVVRANGQVVASSGGKWFRNDGGRIKPGDTIVVPVDTERLPPLPLWTAVTSIIYNLAIAVAAVNSF